MSSALAPASSPLKTEAPSSRFSVDGTQYDLFGNITSETNAAIDHIFGFTGRERDEESDFYYYRARYYDPKTGQFASEDPIGFAARDPNLNRYVGNNATGAVDPSGLVGNEVTAEPLEGGGASGSNCNTGSNVVDANGDPTGDIPDAKCDGKEEKKAIRIPPGTKMLDVEILLGLDPETFKGKRVVQRDKEGNPLFNYSVYSDASGKTYYVRNGKAYSSWKAMSNQWVWGQVLREVPSLFAQAAGNGMGLMGPPVAKPYRAPTGQLLNGARGLVQNPMFKNALQIHKGTGQLTNAGRALTKHPEMLGHTKATLRAAIGKDPAVNQAAHSLLKDIMRKGTSTTAPHSRYGTITTFRLPNGLGARFETATNILIGFVN